MKGIVILNCVLFFSLSSIAQDRDRARTQEYLQQIEQQKKAATLREYDSAVYYLEQEMYEKADAKFRIVLANIKSVPSDLTFHFGKNSFHLGQYRQSIDWLNKYIQLKGTNGQFSNQAVELKTAAEAEYLKQKSQSAKTVSQVLSVNYDIDCGPSGKVICPVCKGDHVIIKKGTFSDEYRTCSYCDERGTLTCPEYNQLLRGELKPKR